MGTFPTFLGNKRCSTRVSPLKDTIYNTGGSFYSKHKKEQQHKGYNRSGEGD